MLLASIVGHNGSDRHIRLLPWVAKLSQIWFAFHRTLTNVI